MSDRIKVVFSGVCGRMGQAILKGIIDEEDIQVVGVVDVTHLGEDIGAIIGMGPRNLFVDPDLDQVLKRTDADVLLDFTIPETVAKNIGIALDNHVASVVGTTGLAAGDLEKIRERSRECGVPVFIAPNFALGAILMMRFAKEAGRFFPHVEIIEMHHDQKMDAPSGTALKTLELIDGERQKTAQGAAGEFEKITGARGGEFNGMRVHSVRLPGLVAHQEVIFGGTGQTLTIRHDTINRECYIPGVLLALRNIANLAGVVFGLEQLLW